MPPLNPSTRIYLVVLFPLSVAFFFATRPRLSILSDLTTIIFLLILCILAHRLSVVLSKYGSVVAPEFAVEFAMVLVLGPHLSAIVIVGVAFFVCCGELWRGVVQKNRALVILATLSTAILECLVSGFLYYTVAGGPISTGGLNLSAAFAAAMGFLFVNTVTTTVFVVLEEKVSPQEAFFSTWKALVFHYFCLPLLGGPIALLFSRQPLALPLLAIPIYGMYLAILRTQEMVQATQTAIETTARALDARDHYTYGHSARVGAMAWAVGRQMGLDTLGAKELERAGLIHDIGKVAIPDAILHKRGKLSLEERIIIRGHVRAGEMILSPLRPLDKLTFSAFSHHEKMDGTGYPRGLVGEAIPLWARILAVADTFDALTSDRPYRKGMPDSEAIEIIKQGTGSHFDPLVVAAFLGVHNAGTLGRVRFRCMEVDFHEQVGAYFLAILKGS